MNVELIERGNNKFYCPSCHKTFKYKQIRTAQFGGQNGGIPPQYNAVPWATPQTRTIGYGNPTDPEIGLDGYMSKTRKSVEDDNSGYGLEKKLEMFHVGLEEDLKPYELTSRQRQVQKMEDALRRRDMYKKKLLQSIQENSVEYIKEHFKTPEKYLKSFESQLDVARTNIEPPRYNLPTFSKHDESFLPPPFKIKTSGRLASTKVQHGRNTPFDSEEDADNPSTVWSKLQKTYPYEAGFRDHTSWVYKQSDLYNDMLGNEEMKFLVAPEDTTAFPKHSPRPYESYAPFGGQSIPSKEDVSPIDNISEINNPFLPLSVKIDKLHRSVPKNLPNDPFPGEDASRILMRPPSPHKPFGAYQDRYYYQSTADGTPLG